VYFGQWYRDFDLTGGLWLQKATHDFDYINQLVQSQPVAIAAVGSRRVFGGDMPPDLHCSACERTDSCPESPRAIAERGDDGGMGCGDHACAFSSSIRNHACGAHTAYCQNFLSRRSAAWRGARVTGYRGTLQFDWFKDSITVVDHHSNTIDEIKMAGNGEHHGGDANLMRNFVDVIRREDASHTTLADGILSASMCVAAQTSEENTTFEPVRTYVLSKTPA
jgi:predicted dehydrogenase